MAKIFKDTNNPYTAFKRYQKEKKERNKSFGRYARLKYRQQTGKEYKNGPKTEEEFRLMEKFFKQIKRETK